VRPDVPRVRGRDVTRADDADAEGGHGWRGYGIEAESTAPASRVSGIAYRHAMRLDQIALQLYTVRTLARTDLAGTLAAVAAAGYRAVELAGLPDTPTEELARILRDAGLAVVASHEAIEGLRADPDGVAEKLVGLGCPRAIVPWMPEEDRRTVDDVRRFAAEVGGFAATFAGHGISLGYHNHAFEFAPLDGTTVWDVLLDTLPPSMELELDVHWAAAGGRDPVAEIRKHAGRIRLLHMKDRTAGPEPHDAPPGEGILPFPAIVQAGREAGVEWYIVEQDEPVEPLADITRGLRYLTTLAAG
jgi:sugar phosphate isomerase/epimerase